MSPRIRTGLAALVVLALFGCPADDDDTSGSADDDSAGDDDTAGDDDISGDDDTTAPPMEPRFSVAVVADPHAYGGAENLQRLEAAVAWIETHAAERQIELVLILGDVTWNDGFDDARAALDELSMPYVPIIGDNEVHSDDEQAWEEAFASQFEALASELDGWRKAEMPVFHPDAEADVWFQNTAFDVQGVHFVGLDWAARGVDGILGEAGFLHDFDGGTFPWFEDEVAAAAEGAEESVIFFTHIPMHLGAFDLEQMAALTGVTGPAADLVYANLAGHVHVNAEVEVEDGGYTVFVTDAVWDDENTVRMIQVSGNGLRFEYEHELVIVP